MNALGTCRAVVALLVSAVGVGCATEDVPDVASNPIVGGVVVRREEEATTPIVYIALAGNRFCSGTLVADEVVLTAAHCLGEEIRGVVVRYAAPTGVANLSIPVAEKRPHPRHRFVGQPYAEDLAHIKYDIGLVRLASPAPSTKPRASLLGEEDHSWIEAHLGTPSVVVMGYGATSIFATHNNARDPFRGDGVVARSETMIDPVTNVRLDVALAAPNNEAVVLDHALGAQVCHGDSGGPAFARDTFVVVAVSSWILGSLPGRRRCNLGSVHATVSHPENAQFLASVLGSWTSGSRREAPPLTSDADPSR